MLTVDLQFIEEHNKEEPSPFCNSLLIDCSEMLGTKLERHKHMFVDYSIQKHVN